LVVSAKQWLLGHPRVHFHYAPTHACWMNMIECFFSILTRQALTHSVQRTKKDLKDFLLRYLKKYSENPMPFTWTKGPTISNASFGKVLEPFETLDFGNLR
jgi:hypothetical protein